MPKYESKGNKDPFKNIYDILNFLSNIPVPVTGYSMVLGGLLTASFIFYKLFNQNPFALSDKGLRDHVGKALKAEYDCQRELEDLKRIKSRIEKGELNIDDTQSLEAKISQLDECVKMAKTKRKVVEIIMMVKENSDVFQELFGEKGFNKIVSSIDELNNTIEKELKKQGIDKIDIVELTEYMRNIFPLIIKDPEKFKSEPSVQEPIQPEKPETPEFEEVEKLLNEGSPQQWIEFLMNLHSKGGKLKLPPGRYYTKKGYRNLLIALYSIDLNLEDLRKSLDDKVLIRIAEYLKNIKEGKQIEVDPMSSDYGYIDDSIHIICGEKVGEEVKDNTKVELYKFTDVNQENVVIEKRIIKDSITGKAVKVVIKKQ